MKTRLSRTAASAARDATHADQVQRRRAASLSSAGERTAAQLQASARMVAQRQQVEATFGPAAQRQDALEEDLPLQGRFADVTQRAPEDDELLQGRFAPAQAKAEPNQTGMPDALKTGIESLSGMDMSSVRVHTNSDKPAQLNALAYAQGNDIHLAAGQEQHLPHEAWHVVQQRQGRVQPTMQMQGVSVNDDPGLENEADVMGARALSNGSTAA